MIGEDLGEVKMERAKIDSEVTTDVGTKSVGDEVGDPGSTPCSIPKLILKLLFGVQIHVVYLAMGCVFKLFKGIPNKVFNSLRCRKEAKEAKEAEPVPSKDVVKALRRFQRSVLTSTAEMFGIDMDDVVKLVDEVHEARDVGDNKREMEALEKLEELDRPYRYEPWNNHFLSKVKFTSLYTGGKDKTADYGDGKYAVSGKDYISSDEEGEIENDSLYDQLKSGDENRVTKENALLKSRLAKTNAKLEEVLRMSSHLVEKLSKLNIQVEWMTSLSDRMTEMKGELEGRKKMLCEIEEERNRMKEKLFTLERLIKEEEQYLDDFSGESGFECDSPKNVKTYKLDCGRYGTCQIPRTF